MQIVKFQCGNCGRLMGVDAAYLGRQVRCPNCQQVVVAPPPEAPQPAAAPAAAPPSPPDPFAAAMSAPLPDLKPMARDDADDIFAPPEADDLFGSSAPVPRLEIPPAAEPPREPERPAEPAFAPPPPAAEPPSLSAFEDHQPAAPPPEAPAGDGAAFADESAGPFTDAPTDGAALAPPPSARRKAARGGVPTILIVFPLLSYAVLATVLGVLLYLRSEKDRKDLQEALDKRSPYEVLPDFDGDLPLARQPGAEPGESPYVALPDFDGDAPGPDHRPPQPPQIRFNTNIDLVSHPIPDHLRVRLGETRQFGDLEVTPLRVERRKVAIWDRRSIKPQLLEHDSVVLFLKLRNVSNLAGHQPLTFAPLDNYFDRQWNQKLADERQKFGKTLKLPFTHLEVGPDRFFGGPCDWVALNETRGARCWLDNIGKAHRANDPRLDAQDYPLLKPGEEAETFVCTDGYDERVEQKLDGYRGPLLYRVQLRRGLIEFNGKKYPATMVIGVPFDNDDIKTVREP